MQFELCYSARTAPQKKRADLWLRHKSTLDRQPYTERMKIMASHSSAPKREQAPHETQRGGTTQSSETTQASETPETTQASEATEITDASDVILTTLIRRTRTATIINALKERALSVLNDKSIDAESRAVIRYALETNDPWLAELVRRAEKREATADIEAAADSVGQLARDSARS